MVPLEPQAPCAALAGLAEDSEVVHLRVSGWPFAGLEDAKHILKRPNGLDLLIASKAEAGAQHVDPGIALSTFQLFEWDALAVARDVVPVEPLLRIERQGGLGRLLGPQRRKESLRRHIHFRLRSVFAR